MQKIILFNYLFQVPNAFLSFQNFITFKQIVKIEKARRNILVPRLKPGSDRGSNKEVNSSAQNHNYF